MPRRLHRAGPLGWSAAQQENTNGGDGKQTPANPAHAFEHEPQGPACQAQCPGWGIS